MKKPTARRKSEKSLEKDRDTPRDLAFVTGAAILKYVAEVKSYNSSLKPRKIESVSADVQRRLGLLSVELGLPAQELVDLFVSSSKPGVVLRANSLLSEHWKEDAMLNLSARRRASAAILGSQTVRTAQGEVSASSLSDDVQFQVCYITDALDYAWSQIRAVTGRCVMRPEAVKVLLSPLGNIEAWARCFLSGLNAEVVKAHGLEAATELNRNPMLKSTLKDLAFNVSALMRMTGVIEK